MPPLLLQTDVIAQLLSTMDAASNEKLDRMIVFVLALSLFVGLVTFLVIWFYNRKEKKQTETKLKQNIDEKDEANQKRLDDESKKREAEREHDRQLIVGLAEKLGEMAALSVENSKANSDRIKDVAEQQKQLGEQTIRLGEQTQRVGEIAEEVGKAGKMIGLAMKGVGDMAQIRDNIKNDFDLLNQKIDSWKEEVTNVLKDIVPKVEGHEVVINQVKPLLERVSRQLDQASSKLKTDNNPVVQQGE